MISVYIEMLDNRKAAKSLHLSYFGQPEFCVEWSDIYNTWSSV